MARHRWRGGVGYVSRGRGVPLHLVGVRVEVVGRATWVVHLYPICDSNAVIPYDWICDREAQTKRREGRVVIALSGCSAAAAAASDDPAVGT